MVSLRGLTLTAARPRIIVPLFARDPAALCPLAKAASADPAAELVELRLDPLPADEFLNALALVRGIVDKPLVVTIRTSAKMTPSSENRATPPTPPGPQRFSASITLTPRPPRMPWRIP